MGLVIYRRCGEKANLYPICGGFKKFHDVNCGQFFYNRSMKSKLRLWIARGFIAIVVFFNLDAAFSFMLHPGLYAPGFELTGVPGNAMIQGLGLLFLMWNVPYMIALLNPKRHFTSLIEAVVMQAIGVAGETMILLLMESGHPYIEASTLRFIVFDGGGLIFLLIAFWITWRGK